MSAETSVNNHKSLSLLTRRWFWAVLIGLVIIAGGIWILFSSSKVVNSSSDRVASLEPAPVAGHAAPDFELATPTGEKIRLSDYRGKPVIVNFWATWCGPCRAEFPEFQ